MKKILFLLLCTVSIYGQTYQNPTFGKVKIKSNTTDNNATKVVVQSTDGSQNTVLKTDLQDVISVASAINLPVTGVAGKFYYTQDDKKYYNWNGTIYEPISSSSGSGKEDVSNKQNSLAIDGTGVKYPTVDAVNTQFNLVQNQISSIGVSDPSTYVVTDAGYSQSGQNITLNAYWEWVIDANSYTLSSPVVINVPLATAGNSRIDLIVLNDLGTAVRVAGTESVGTPVAPTVPENTIKILFLLTDSTSSSAYNYATKADINSPAFTGTPTAPTATVGTNTTQIATTAFVLANAGALPAHLEYNNTDKTIWNNGKGDIEDNTSFGEFSLSSNTTGDFNTANGNSALRSNTTGSGNVAIGAFAGSYSNNAEAPLTNAINSVFIGATSSANGDGNVNEIVIGANAQGNGSNTVTIGEGITKTYLKGVINTSKTYTVATLPTGVLGDTTIVTDLLAPTYMATAVGGGSVVWKVFYDGTSWKVD